MLTLQTEDEKQQLIKAFKYECTKLKRRLEHYIKLCTSKESQSLIPTFQSAINSVCDTIHCLNNDIYPIEMAKTFHLHVTIPSNTESQDIILSIAMNNRSSHQKLPLGYFIEIYSPFNEPVSFDTVKFRNYTSVYDADINLGQNTAKNIKALRELFLEFRLYQETILSGHPKSDLRGIASIPISSLEDKIELKTLIVFISPENQKTTPFSFEVNIKMSYPLAIKEDFVVDEKFDIFRVVQPDGTVYSN